MTGNIFRRGERGYCRKGWRTMAARDNVIRKRHVACTRRKRRPLTPGESIARLAYQFRLSERRVEQIIYREE